MIDLQEAHRRLAYEPATGVLTWRIDCAPRSRAGCVAGSVHGSGYIEVRVLGRVYKAHRLAWFMFHGEWPAGEVDHINGDPGDNRLANLRLTDRATNMQNQRRAHSRKNSTGLLGVSRRRDGFLARIQVNKKSHDLGRFPTAEEAHEAYVQAKRRLHSTCTI
jgi:hypothetical protein